MKKRNKIIVSSILCILIVSSVFLKIDLDQVKSGEKPIFAIEIWRGGSSSEKDYIGLLYQFTEVFYDTPTSPLNGSPSVKVGIWFFPFYKVYSRFGI